MKVITLVENTSISNLYGSKHGLSFYIETKNHRILFDVGPTNLFLKNAEKLGVDISKVDTVIISHGHYDHGGGLRYFLKANTGARIYVQNRAFEKHYTKEFGMFFSVGLDPRLAEEPRIVHVNGNLRIDDELTIFADVTGTECTSSMNDSLYMKQDGRAVPDDFAHEQNLIITEAGKTVLVAGCAHRGILNIMKRAEERLGKAPDCTISGFHLYNPVTKKHEDDAIVTEIGKRLAEYSTQYYTCHCTGFRVYNVLRDTMGNRIEYLATGSTLEI